MGTIEKGVSSMAIKDAIERFTDPRSMSHVLRKYKCNPERLYYTLIFLTYPSQQRYKNVKPLYRSISNDNVESGNINRRIEFAEFIIANRRIDLVFEVFSNDDLYLEPSLKLLRKLGLEVEVNTLEEV